MCTRGVDVPVSAADFEYVRRLVADDSALALSDGKEYLVHSRLSPLAERQGLASVTELINRVRMGAPDLRREVVEALVTHETLFFRDVHPFEALRQEVIPSILRANGGGHLSIWSAGVATGQEAYSMALLVREHFLQVPDVSILATDISRQVLEYAQTARFSQLEVNRGLPAALLVKHFDQHGREWQLHDDVRRMVTFRQLNLARPLSGIAPMDVVFLRNVLIYFDADAKLAVLERVSRILRPGGYLFLGGADTLCGLDDAFERVELGRSISYRRIDRGTHSLGRDRH
jgi:chemotaxis protein methyltransferase CheR